MGLIRLLLALSVVVLHTNSSAPIPMVGGRVAVQTFYIISGFYMAMILNEKYKPGKAGFRLFFSNRLLLLFPVYFAILLLSVAWLSGVWVTTGRAPGEFANWVQLGPTLNLPARLYLVASHLLIVGQDVGVFLSVNPATGTLVFGTSPLQQPHPVHQLMLVPQAWSIGLELMFYAIAPFLVRRSWRLVGSVMLASLALRLVLIKYFGLFFDPWSHRFFPTDLAWFLMGALAYKAYSHAQVSGIRFHPRLAKALFGLVTALIVFLLLLPLPGKIPLFYLLFVLSLPVIFDLTKRHALDRYIGQLSYPVYMTHWFVLTVLATVGVHGNILLTALGTLSLSVVLQRFLVQPLDAYRQARAQTPEQEPPARAAASAQLAGGAA